MKRVSLILIFSVFCIAFNSYSQDYAECKAKLTKLKRACDKLNPSDELSIEFINTVDEIARLPMKAGSPTNWYVVGPLFDEMLDLYDDVKQKQCTSATCRKAKEIRTKLKKELKK